LSCYLGPLGSRVVSLLKEKNAAQNIVTGTMTTSI
jgi:hypothetical protein